MTGVPLGEQVLGRGRGAGGTVHVDPGMVIGGVPRPAEGHAWDTACGEVGRAAVGRVGGGEDEPVQVPAVEQVVVRGDLFRVGGRRVEHHAVVALCGSVGERVQEAVEDAVGRCGLDAQTQHPRPTGAELLRGAVRPVAQVLDRGSDALGGVRPDQVRRVEHVGDGLRGDSGAGRDGAERGSTGKAGRAAWSSARKPPASAADRTVLGGGDCGSRRVRGAVRAPVRRRRRSAHPVLRRRRASSSPGPDGGSTRTPQCGEAGSTHLWNVPILRSTALGTLKYSTVVLARITQGCQDSMPRCLRAVVRGQAAKTTSREVRCRKTVRCRTTVSPSCTISSPACVRRPRCCRRRTVSFVVTGRRVCWSPMYG